ncbi:MAG: uracil phosphoribosyltransferase [Actinobacteria bacterium]|nr:MAG: uracil phosphoribosyltransferase [Actinomycetota bacterium]
MLGPMAVVVDHPLVAERLTRLRDKTTKRAEFRRNLAELTSFFVYEAVREQPVVVIEIDSPLAPTKGVAIADPPIVVPVMRAGLGMHDATLTLIPNARVGFVGVRRDEETFMPHAYVNTVPEHLAGRRVLVLDPMLATGGSLIHTCELLRHASAGHMTVVCVLASPQGVATFGDAGDRQFGLA